MATKQRKSLLKKCAALLTLLFLTLFPLATSAKDTTTQVAITLKATYNGQPQVHQEYIAQNYQQAFDAIEIGKIPSSQTTSASWIALRQAVNSPTTGAVITFPDGLTLGPGISHTPAETRRIMTLIAQSGNVGLLNALQPFVWPVKFTTPNNQFMVYTNSSGEAVGRLSLGETEITDGAGNFLKFVTITPQSSLLPIDLANLNSDMTFSLIGQSPSEKNAFGQYIVASGKTLTFQIHLSSAMTAPNTTFQLAYMPGIFLESVTDASGSNLPLSQSITSTTGIAKNDQTGRPYTQQTAWNIQSFTLPAAIPNETLTVKAHLVPTGLNAITSIGWQLQIKALNSYGQAVTATAPTLNLTGINFAMMDPAKNELIPGGTYLLGRIDNGVTQLYNATAGWQNVANLQSADISSFLQLKGGYQYQIGSPTETQIPYVTGRYGFSATKSATINASLIQISGLAQAADYFLYQATPPQGYTKDTQLHKFSTFNTLNYGPNNTVQMTSSVTKAALASISLDSEIPDYKANANVYNVLPISGKYTATSPKTQIVGMFIGIALMSVALIFGILSWDLWRARR
jgi:hypothetical protein